MYLLSLRRNILNIYIIADYSDDTDTSYIEVLHNVIITYSYNFVKNNKETNSI